MLITHTLLKGTTRHTGLKITTRFKNSVILPVSLAALLSGCVTQQTQTQDQSSAGVDEALQATSGLNQKTKATDGSQADSPQDRLHKLQALQALNEQDLAQQGLLKHSVTKSGSPLQSTEPSAVPDYDLWHRLLQNFQMDLDVDNPRIQAQLNWFKRNPRYLERVFNRSERYLYHVVEQIEAKGLPGELALLPIVESAYDPFAYSHGRASGMWQFIPSTARYFGIKSDWWYDGRRDVIDSTDTALNYLQKLNNRFDGNWLHALAAYNAGGGNVNRSIRKNREAGKSTDFWSLNLPNETEAYVPKLIALAKLVKEADHYGLDFRSIPNKPYFTAVDTKAQIDLAQAAKLAEITIDELYLLNPGFSQWATSPNGPHRLLVPVEKADTFKKNLSQLPPSQRMGWQRYTIKSGDSLIRIAKQFNTSPQMIRNANQIKGNSIRAGKKLLIPIPKANAKHYALSAKQRLKQKQNYDRSHTGGKRVEYHVKSGDSFWSISRKHKVGMRELARWNGMAPTDPLKPGKKLVIWSKKSAGSASASSDKRKIIRKVGYKVRQGDSLARIADKFNVRVKDIVSWNKISRKKYLQPGQSLTLYVDVTRNH